MITWCGDGVVDNYRDVGTNTQIREVCDPGDTRNKEGWGANGGTCSNTCQPVDNPDPAVCTDIDVKPTSGEAPLPSNFTCNATDASSYRIVVKNGSTTLKTINKKNGSYTFTNAGNYTVQCYVDGNTTSNACKKTVTVGEPEPENYDLALRKTLSSTTPGPFNPGDDVRFNVRVFNQGDIASGQIQVTDYIPNGLTLIPGNGWTQSGNKATRTISSIGAGNDRNVTISFTIDSDAAGTIRNFAEISSDNGDDCDSNPDSINGGSETWETTGMIDDEIGGGCNSGWDEDDHDVAVIIVEDDILNPDVVLTKELAPGQSSVVLPWEDIEYSIVVTNTLSGRAEGYEVFDYFPSELTLNDTDWTVISTWVARYNNTIDLDGGESVELRVTFTLNNSAQGTILNRACVWAESDPDCVPDECDVNDAGLCCDITNEQYDEEGCSVVTTPSININKLDANPTLDLDWNVWNDTQKVDKGNKAVFSIRVTNDGPVSLDTIVLTDARALNCAGSVTLPGTYPSTWIGFITGGSGSLSDTVLEPGEWFEYTCEKLNTQSDYINTAAVTAEAVETDIQVNDDDTSSVDTENGGGNGWTQCTWSSQSGSVVTCTWRSTADSFYLKCGSVIMDPVNATTVFGKRQATFNCSLNAYQCYSDDNSVPTGATKTSEWFKNQAWRTSTACRQDGPGGWTCGNGIREWSEQCDMGSDNGALVWGASYCEPSTCRIRRWTCEDTNTCTQTWPNGGDMTFWLSAKSIIGHGTDPLEWMGSISLTNDSDYDLVFSDLCVKRADSSEKKWTEQALKSGNASGEYCADITSEVIYPYETITLDEFGVTPDYEWNKNGVSGDSYGDTTLIASVKANGIDYSNAYFAERADIRVAKPAVVTTGGGASYIKTTTTSDVAEIKDNATGNTNFVGTSVGDGVSSNTQEVTSTNAVDAAEEESNEYKQAVESVTDTTATTTSTVSSFVDTNKYNGLDNVYIIKGKNVTLDSMPSQVNESTTFIVEGGNLTITGDMVTNENVAFVVKGGNIIIKSDVTQIDGTYISIPVWANGGNISSEASADQLVVNGSLYGNIDNLVANRYYISDDSSGQLWVGTIVSFGSSLFSKPAPLVSQFVGEYLESEKVAK
jgi:uncharacterized repeat protein (TIGR01451 family)